MTSSYRHVAVCVAIVGVSGWLGCEVPRPRLSVPERVDAGDDDSDDATSDENDDTDESDTPELPASRDASTAKDAGDAGSRDAGSRDASTGTSDAGTTPDAGNSPLAGDYWMRSEGSAEQRFSLLGGLGEVTIDTRRVAYSLVRVAGSGSALTLTDLQCAASLEQRCTFGCETMTTTPRDASTSARAFAPATRKLDVATDGSWRASAVPFAVGYQGTDANAALPARDGDPLSYDPDGGGDGVDWTSRMKITLINSTCSMRLAQRVNVSYAGTLVNGALASGTVADQGSTQSVLSISASCSSGRADAVATAPSALKLVRKTIPASGSSWTCPSVDELAAAFR